MMSAARQSRTGATIAGAPAIMAMAARPENSGAPYGHHVAAPVDKATARSRLITVPKKPPIISALCTPINPIIKLGMGRPSRANPDRMPHTSDATAGSTSNKRRRSGIELITF